MESFQNPTSPRSNKAADYFKPIHLPKTTKNVTKPADTGFTAGVQRQVTIKDKPDKKEADDEFKNFGFGEPKLLLPRVMDSDSEDDHEKEPYNWKDEDYWKLPKNVQQAVDLACTN